MNMRLNEPSIVVAGYVRRSSPMQADNFSIDAQRRAIIDEANRRGLPAPVFYEDDERSARSEQIARRPAFKRLLEDVEAGRVQLIMVHTLDRWSRNVMVTLKSFRILAEQRTAFLSLSEHIDYSTPEGRLQLTILAAFAAYFSDMLGKHTSKGKAERAIQGLYNGHIPFGYRRTGPKLPPEHDPNTFPGLRMIGELRMQGMTAELIADAVNKAGYRIYSRHYRSERPLISATIRRILNNEFYAPFDPDDDRGTVLYHGKRYRGLHPAAFTYEEWQRIQVGNQLNYHAPHRAAGAHFYEFSGYISDIHCGLKLRCHRNEKHGYYKDMAKARRMPCPAGGYLQVRTEMVRQQFGQLLGGLRLPMHWREEIRQKLIETAVKAGLDSTAIEREKERLKLKRSRILKQHRDGYIDDREFEGEMAAVELALRSLEIPEVDGLKLDAIIAAGERLPGMAALWEVATPEERREMVILLLEPGGLYYDLELQMIAAIKPKPVFLPTLRLLNGVVEYEEASGLLVIAEWQQNTQRWLRKKP